MRFLPGNDLTLGNDTQGSPVKLTREQRATHLYTCGSTGSGKTKFLERLIRQDILNWRYSKCGLLLIDPHGALYDSLMEWAAHNKLDRPIVPINLRSSEWIVAYNMLRERAGADPAVVASSYVQAIAHVWGQAGVSETPLFARWAGNILRTLYETKQTLVEAEYLIDHISSDVRHVLSKQVRSASVLRDWKYANTLSPKEFEDKIGSTINRLTPFLDTRILRLMFGQPEVSLDLHQSIEEGLIILVNLNPEKSTVGQEHASLFASLLLSDVWAAAKERGKGDTRNPMKPFYVYIDEFQTCVTPTIAKSLDQARGFGLHLTLAHQFPTQLLNEGPHGKAIYDSVMVNAKSKAIFQIETEDNLKPLAHSLFTGVMNPDEIKLELYSTKVMGHRKEIRTSTTRSSSTSETNSSGTTNQIQVGGMNVISDNISENISSTYGTSEGLSETEMEVDAAVFGQEPSSVQYRNLDEQKFRAMQRIFLQEKRACIVRIAEERLPQSIHVPEVESFSFAKGKVPEYVKKQAEKWTFMLPRAEADAGLDVQEDNIRKMVAIPDGEPRTAKRKIS